MNAHAKLKKVRMNEWTNGEGLFNLPLGEYWHTERTVTQVLHFTLVLL